MEYNTTNTKNQYWRKLFKIINNNQEVCAMYQQERIDEIVKILKKYNYVTVDYLVKEIKYSPASIRRDLALLEKQGLVTRSYGGVTFKDANISPFRFRQHSMKSAKNTIAQRAASLVKNGDVIFIDGSSTAQYMGRFLTEKKGITVITCNMILADFLSEHGVNTYCTGGKVIEYPGILGGSFMLDTLSKFNLDIVFFASVSINSQGCILSSDEASILNHQFYRKHAKKLAYLCGSDKFDTGGKYASLKLSDIDFFISDGNLSKKLKQDFKTTKFICTN